MKSTIVAALFVLSLAACGDNGTPAPESDKEAMKPGTQAPAPMAEKSAPEHDTHAPAAEPSARTPSPPGAKVFLIVPQDGDTVYSPVAVKFGVEGMEVVPAGTDQSNSGHHHLLIDTKIEDYNAPILSDETHKHFGGGQTEAAIGLSKGKHTLQDVFADHNHVPHDPPVESEVITINVD
jgi:predicted small lipoprotein YifL